MVSTILGICEPHWEDDWEAKAELFLDPYPCEAVLLKMVRVEIEGF